MDAPEHFAAVVEKWPKPHATTLAADLNVSPIAVRAWKWRGIPGEYWTRVAAAAVVRGIDGISIELLAELGERAAHARAASKSAAEGEAA